MGLNELLTVAENLLVNDSPKSESALLSFGSPDLPQAQSGQLSASACESTAGTTQTPTVIATAPGRQMQAELSTLSSFAYSIFIHLASAFLCKDLYLGRSLLSLHGKIDTRNGLQVLRTDTSPVFA